MKKYLTLSLVLILILLVLSFFFQSGPPQKKEVLSEQTNILPPRLDYWMLLQRKSKQEYLFKGIPGDQSKSTLIKQFPVNVGISGERPTPLPQLVGKEYWNIIAKNDVRNDPETAPYFLTLDVPWSDEYPFGPAPYTECNGEQCDWVRPGSFGLHGIAATPEKLTDEGSSGCIRHTDEDITYLYNLLTPSEQTPIRYYVEDV